MKQLPNILTLANLFLGTLAIVYTLQHTVFLTDYLGEDYLVTAPPPVYWASVFIAAAAVMDVFDGLVARWLRAASPLGRELDSLADVVTFGVAPGIICYELLRGAYMRQPGAMELSQWLLLPALLLPCFSAYRLAKFNIDERQAHGFLGMPTPAVGLLVASFPLILLQDPAGLGAWLQKPWVLYLVVILCGLLMISEIPFFSLKVRDLSWKSNGPLYIVAALTAAGIPLLHWGAVPLAFALYVLVAVGRNWIFPPPPAA